MKTVVNLLLLCFCLLFGSAYVHASACRALSPGENKLKQYATVSAGCSKCSSAFDVSTNENDLVFTTEDEDDEYENKKHESLIKFALSNLCLLISINSCGSVQGICCSSSFHHNSPIYISQRVLRI